MKWRVVAVLASFAMLAAAFSAVASENVDVDNPSGMTALDDYIMAKTELERQSLMGVKPYVSDVEAAFTYADGPYLRYNEDGSPRHVHTATQSGRMVLDGCHWRCREVRNR
jgi:hypothetical protein